MPRMHPRLDRLDRRIAAFMHRVGHPVHRVTLALFFVWVGLLKQFGYTTGSSLLAQTVYLGSPGVTVAFLGWWEVAIGLSLLHPATIRVSILLMAIRVPGTVLALILKADVCFHGAPWAPTPEGQYLIKDLMLLGAAMVIGGTVRHRHRPETAAPAE